MRRANSSGLILLAGLLAVAGCQPGRVPKGAHSPAGASTAKSDSGESAPASTPIAFVDVAPERGLEFVYRNDEEQDRFAIVESMGGGVGLLDYDGDGWLDVWLPGGGRFAGPQQLAGRPPGLFRSLAAGRQYVDVATAAGVGASRYYSYGVAAADVDHDGFPDVLATGYGGLQFYRNQGDGTFVEGADGAGLLDQLWSTSAAWGDLNGDQQLDLYVAHYVNWSFANDPACSARPPQTRDVCPPRRFEPLPDALYFGNGDGTFREASAEAGLRRDGKGLGVALVDIDVDGDLDIYVANDTEGNFLYRNDGRGRFEDLSVVSGAAFNERGLPDGSMGVGVGDFDGDGLTDFLVTNYEGEDAALYQNLGGATFRHVSRLQGVTAVGSMFVGWGVGVLDADNDGDLDAVLANGHAIRFPGESGLAQRPLCFENRAARFVNVAPQIGGYFAALHRGRGLAVGDLDRDGRVDLAASHVNEPAALLLNRSEPSRPHLRVRLVGRRSARDAVGAVVELEQSQGRQVRQVAGGGSYESASDRSLHFGWVPENPARRLRIRWPSGGEQSLDIAAGVAELVVVESTAAAP